MSWWARANSKKIIGRYVGDDFFFGHSLPTVVVLLPQNSSGTGSMAEINPFASLFHSEEDTRVGEKSVESQLQEVNTLLSRVFLFTVSGT